MLAHRQRLAFEATSPPAFEPLYAVSACLPPKYVHFQAVSSIHLNGNLKLGGVLLNLIMRCS